MKHHLTLEECGEVLTVAECQQVLQLSRNAVYEAIRTGALPSIRLGRRLLVPRRALEKLLSGETIAPTHRLSQDAA